MKLYRFVLSLILIFSVAECDLQVSQRPLIFHNWPPKSAKLSTPHPTNGAGKKRTVVVQIRSDQPVPLVFNTHPNIGHLHSYPYAFSHNAQGYMRSRPLKLSAPMYLKGSMPTLTKPKLRKPLKIKLQSTALKTKKPVAYDKPFRYETPAAIFHSHFDNDIQKLPLETHSGFISNNFAPIHTIPAPNLAIQDNYMHKEEAYTSPKPLRSNQKPSTKLGEKRQKHRHQSIESITNDQTIHDPHSGLIKLFAPDPDPSLPTSKIRPAVEHFNQPSNGKPLPVDVQTNFLSPAQPLVQIINTEQVGQNIPEIYPVQFTQQAQLQPIVSANVAAVHTPPIPMYNPTYLVTQSNNLYMHHKEHLFNPHIVETSYANADLTQEVASDGQILQAAKDHHNYIHPIHETPHFAALIAAPALGGQDQIATAPFHFPNADGVVGSPESGFVVSHYYGNSQDSSQLLQAYAEEEAQHQKYNAEQAIVKTQKPNEFIENHEQPLYLQQQDNNYREILTQHDQQQTQQHPHQQNLEEQQRQHSVDLAAAAFEEHQRLVHKQLGETPLRIFVPDESSSEMMHLQKRSDNKKTENVDDVGHTQGINLFEGASSVEVSSENQSDVDNKE